MPDKIEALRLSVEGAPDANRAAVLLVQGVTQLAREASGNLDALSALDDAAIPLATAITANTDQAPPAAPAPPADPPAAEPVHQQQKGGHK